MGVQEAQMLVDLATRARSIEFGDAEEWSAVKLRTETFFRKLAPEDVHYVKKLSRIGNTPSVYPASRDQYEASWNRGRTKLVTLIEAFGNEVELFGVDTREPDGRAQVVRVCERFHVVVRQLRSRHHGRPAMDVEDEYDVQDLLHALLRVHFDDIRSEEYTPSYAGKSSRMDFLLKRHGIVIEVKKTRAGLGAPQIGDQLIEDITRYAAHPACELLICFVYDPERRVGNPRGVESDLSRDDGGFPVRVLIRPL